MKNERRYDIDWIRVIVFDILIIYHVCMFFVPWDWVLKNDDTIEWLKWPMIFINRWRLPILFLISGMGTYFALNRRNAAQFAIERLKRLFIPLIVGILLIVAPQVYIVRISEGNNYVSYFQFYLEFFDGIYPEGNFSWMHLWFLPYLLVMSLISIPFLMYVKKEGNRVISNLRSIVKRFPLTLYIFIIPLFVAEVYLEPYYPITNALFGDWYALVHFFICFLSGFLLISLGDDFWDAVKKIKKVAIVIGLISFPIMLWMWENYLSIFWIPLFASLNIWSWILVILGFSATYFNKESRIIKYRNRAVYPFYILHQTFILIIAFFLKDYEMNALLKLVIMVLVTYLGCWLLFEFLLRRFKITRFLFGIKN